MRIRLALGVLAVAVSLTACQEVMAPQPAEEITPAFAVGSADQQTGPNNRCYGQIVSGIASTWPWAHNEKVAFPPPPGALALWLETFGPVLGISTVRELQVLFCG